MAILGATAPLHSAHPYLGRRYVRLFLDGLRSGTVSDLGGPPLGDDETGGCSGSCLIRAALRRRGTS
jgi:hypothetical protein